MQTEIDLALRRSSDTRDRFLPAMQAFVVQATPAIDALKATTATLESDLRDLLTFFGEDPATVKPEDVFSTVNNFAHSLSKAHEDMQEETRRRARMAQNGPTKPILAVLAANIKGPDVGKSWEATNADDAKRIIPPSSANDRTPRASTIGRKSWRRMPSSLGEDLDSGANDTLHRSLGRHAVDDALKDLRSGGSMIRRQRTIHQPRPLSRVFLDH